MSDPYQQPPVDYTPLKRSTRRWILAAVVIGLCILIPLVLLQRWRPPRQQTPTQQALRQRDHLLQLGAVLRQYAQHHDGALPAAITTELALRDQHGNPIDPRALLVDPVADGSFNYRTVTPAGEQLRYEAYGDRVVAWTDADGQGRRIVLLNNLEEVVPVADAQLDLHEHRLASAGALNRVQSLELAGDETDEDDDEAAAADSPPPATAPAGGQ